MKNILFFGNSLTAGYGLPAAQAYPSLIQAKLTEEGYNYKVINAGLSGDTSSGGVYRIDRWLNEPVDILVLALGANDGLRGIPTRETTKNLHEIIRKVRLKYPEVKIILSGMEIPDIVPGRYAAEFRKLFRELALKENVSFIPFLLEGVVGNRYLNLPDGVHPNAEGQKVLAQHTWKVLKDLL
ncbi:arylesterase [Pontibacter diazotrophicus]|uniref:Arylesterase n=1 Tax=Pontibacter diazotrophicus TaxID=1400979 RepID=A0A3D8LI98_9BACT|nr:arylesterase [Pontibacter diazotrophicus]RDV17135.1 arylesterase [Pontibacter diazotrophicus]